ncbi:DUF1254 domain-containing protein [Mesorhizobium marinum]|uniref:DUF1254 domain-containing protein n=1 Tax=Mesorhizobium marinum TaxID=3228790 RepID=UPI00346715A0
MLRTLACGLVASTIFCADAAFAADRETVNVDNFARVESDLYFAKFARDGAFGKFFHVREPVPVEKQDVIRMNRDTLYSTALIDLDAGPVVLTVPQTDGRFIAVQVINEDHYTPTVIYAPGEHRFTREEIGTRYVLLLARTFVDPQDPNDLEAVHKVQDSLKLQQSAIGTFEIPNWDTDRATKIRDALNALSAANGGIDSARMFGPKGKVDPVSHLIGTAAGWGGNPPEDALYEGVAPDKNDGKTVYRLTVEDVPVDGFWSISVYNREGFFQENPLHAYSLNNVTAKKGADGSVAVQFGGCGDGGVANCLPITDGWNYLVRMYRPRAEILSGEWTFPAATAAE